MSQTVSFTMHGIGVSGGIAIGHAHLFAGMSAEVDHYEIMGADVPREQRRFDRAVREVKDELKELAESVRHSTASELAPFVKVHPMLLEDAACGLRDEKGVCRSPGQSTSRSLLRYSRCARFAHDSVSSCWIYFVLRPLASISGSSMSKSLFV